MAQFAIQGNWKSIAALASLFLAIGMMAYSTAGGLEDLPLDDKGVQKRVNYGLVTYAAVFAAMVFGFWSKEDVIAIGSIIAFNALLLLDITIRIGVLSFNMH